MKLILVLISLITFTLGLIKVIIRGTRKKTVKGGLALIGVSVAIYIVAAFMSGRKEGELLKRHKLFTHKWGRKGRIYN